MLSFKGLNKKKKTSKRRLQIYNDQSIKGGAWRVPIKGSYVYDSTLKIVSVHQNYFGFKSYAMFYI